MVPITNPIPIIDGQLDPVWYNVTNTHMEKCVTGDNYNEPDNWLDYHTSFRVMWDGDYFYLFMHFMDDTTQTDSSDPYENDGCELYIEPEENRQSITISDPYHNRYVYGETEFQPSVFDLGIGAWFDTEYGYNFELAIPKDDLFSIDLIYDELIAFEVQGNDRDHASRESISKWWSSSNDSWLSIMIWGAAELQGLFISDVLSICMTNAPPEIDGEMEDAWLIAPVVSMNTYVEDTDLTTFSSWKDLQFSYRVMWDDNGFYFFIDVMDDEIATDSSFPYENDSVELYFDAQNIKNDTYIEGNDYQWRYVYGETEYQPEIFDPGIGAWIETDDGYSFELYVPADSLPFDIERDHLFGWEVQVNDRDNGVREAIGKWWSPSNDSWLDPSLFGTASLGCYGPCPDVDVDEVMLTNSYNLHQNYPNPFNPTTEIAYSLDRTSHVKLVIFDVPGREVATLVNGMQNSGNHKVVFDGSDLPSGVYFYKLETDRHVLVKKMILVK